MDCPRKRLCGGPIGPGGSTLRRLPLARLLVDSAITELFGGSLGSPRLSVELLVGPIEVDLDAEQHDAVVGDELADDHRRCDEGATGDQDPVVGTVGVRNGECVEVLSELIDDRRKVDDDEVDT